MDAEGQEPVEDLDLGVSAAEVLLATLVAQFHLPHYNDAKAKTAAHRQLALDWLDWAVCESDRGRALAEAKAQACANARKGGGITYLP